MFLKHLKDDQWKQAAPELNLESHSKGSEYLCKYIFLQACKGLQSDMAERKLMDVPRAQLLRKPTSSREQDLSNSSLPTPHKVQNYLASLQKHCHILLYDFREFTSAASCCCLQ